MTLKGRVGAKISSNIFEAHKYHIIDDNSLDIISEYLYHYETKVHNKIYGYGDNVKQYTINSFKQKKRRMN